MKKRCFVLGWSAITFALSTASAEVAGEAGFFDGIARRAYQAGQYEAALESFQLAWEIAPSPRLLYNIALCADLAGRSDMAFPLYQQYLLGDDSDATRRSEAVSRSERLKPRLALVQIESDPAGANIYVDRKELGQFGVTPTTIALPEGEHQLLLERARFASQSVAVVARRGSIATASALLQPLLGQLSVALTPASATLEFVLSGVSVAGTAAEGSYRLPVGEYQVLASAPGYLASRSPVVVRQNEQSRLELTLVPLPRSVGHLLVSTGQVSAALFIDGQRVAVTPASLEQLEVGAHTLEVRAEERVARRTITVVKGRATYVEIDLGSPAP